MAAIVCLVDAVRRRAGRDDAAGTWVVFLATSLVVVPLAWLVALGYLVWVSLRPAPAPRPGRVLEGVGTIAPVPRRFWAGGADTLVLSGPLAAVLWATGGDLPWWCRWAIGVGYHAVAVGAWGTTPGKRLLGLEVADVRTGAAPGWAAAVLRTAPLLLGLVPYVGSLALFSHLPLLWRDDRRAAHDLLAGTVVVVRSADRTPGAPGPHRGMIQREH